MFPRLCVLRSSSNGSGGNVKAGKDYDQALGFQHDRHSTRRPSTIGGSGRSRRKRRTDSDLEENWPFPGTDMVAVPTGLGIGALEESSTGNTRETAPVGSGILPSMVYFLPRLEKDGPEDDDAAPAPPPIAMR